MSDGMQFLILIKDDERARNHLYGIQISSELFSYKRPKDWDERLVELSEEKIKENKGIREIMSRLMLVFCSCRSRGNGKSDTVYRKNCSTTCNERK